MASMQDIAERAGVSRSAVSFVLNGRQRSDGSISESTRDRILLAAQELGYCRNELARAVVTGRSRILGFVTATPESDAGMRILIGAAQAAEALGYTIKVLSVPDDNISRVVARCQEFRLSGLVTIYLSSHAVKRLRLAVAPLHIPVACVEDQEVQSAGVQVGHDYDAALDVAVAHLWDLGHRNIAFFAAKPHSDFSSQARLAGFLKAMRQRGVDNPSVWVSSWETDTAEKILQASLLNVQRPTAIICATDALALMAMRTARRLGVTVPRDLSVVGCGDLPMAELADPPLTTVEQAFFDLGTHAAQQIIARAESEPRSTKFTDKYQQILLKGRFIQRQSTAPPR